MKIVERTVIEKEVPFSIKPFEKLVNESNDYINIDADWDWLYDEIIDLGYTDDEIEEHYEEFKQVISNFNDSHHNWNLSEVFDKYLMELVQDGYSAEDVINYIKNWFNVKK